MKEYIKKVFQFLGSRIARNIYLWVCILYILFSNDVRGRVYPTSVYNAGILITTSLIFIFTYINNLLLVPKFLARRKTFSFLLTGALLLFLFSFIYVAILKVFIIRFPKIEIHHISLITSPINTAWTLESILFDIQTFVFALFIWQLAITFAWYANDYSRQQKLMEQIKKKQVETELHFLKNQINPHFLFNTLNNLYALAIKKSDKNPDAILRLSAILRYMLYDSNVSYAASGKETEIMQAYIDLELLRLPDGQDFKFNINTDREYSLPPLLWLPVLENIFKHATGIIADKYFIDYNFTIANNVLKIHSTNNRKSKASNNEQSGGIGLTNLRKRLDLLYPGRHTITTKQEADFYTIHVEIKL